MRLREARQSDLEALVGLEQVCFDYDRMSRRSFRRALASETALLKVCEDETGRLLGYGLVFLLKGRGIARLYSMAVDPKGRGQGIARALLKELEKAVVALGVATMRLEVKPDNLPARSLYERLGYQYYATLEDYYEDHSTAARYEKRLRPTSSAICMLEVPFWAQQTDFTCGPAALQMALAWHQPEVAPAVEAELQIWREATTIFMAAGHGGCGPLGLAVAAARRGLHPEVYLNRKGPLFTESVRDPNKKRVIEIVHRAFERQIRHLAIPVHHGGYDAAILQSALDSGMPVLMLISTYHFDRRKVPHWVLAVGYDNEFLYVHDPDVDSEPPYNDFDCRAVPVPWSRLPRVNCYGRLRVRAAVVLGPSQIRPVSEGQAVRPSLPKWQPR